MLGFPRYRTSTVGGPAKARGIPKSRAPRWSYHTLALPGDTVLRVGLATPKEVTMAAGGGTDPASSNCTVPPIRICGPPRIGVPATSTSGPTVHEVPFRRIG